MKYAVVITIVCLLVATASFVIVNRHRIQFATAGELLNRPNRPIDWLNTRNWSVVGLQSGSGSPAALRHGFRWLNTDTTISVDLSMNDSSVAAFLELLYYTQSKSLQITCPQQELFGKTEIKSGWYVCVAKPFNLVKPCLVYSFGMGDPSLWSFDDVVIKKYGCQDMAYDPSVGKPTHRVNELMWFHNVGLSGKDGTIHRNWQVKTLDTILKDNHHVDRIIDILKIDIECSEWGALDAMLATPHHLANVKQLMIEFHPSRKADASAQEFLSFLHKFRELDRLGFKLWRVWNNFACTFRSKRVVGATLYGCHNAYYLNVNYIV